MLDKVFEAGAMLLTTASRGGLLLSAEGGASIEVCVASGARLSSAALRRNGTSRCSDLMKSSLRNPLAPRYADD
jgi:hypothetical protein